MPPIRVKGELLSCFGVDVSPILKEPRGEAEIELEPVDVSKIKAGDEVWVRYKIGEAPHHSFNFPEECKSGMSAVVAHFPKSPEPQYSCDEWGKELDSAFQEHNCKPQEKAKGVEKLDYSSLCICEYADTDKVIEYISTLARKINELIDIVNTKE